MLQERWSLGTSKLWQSHLCFHVLRLTEQERHTREYSIYTECLLSKVSLSGLLLPWPTNGSRIIDGRFVSYKNIQFILQKNIKCCSSDPLAWAALKGCNCGCYSYFVMRRSVPQLFWRQGFLAAHLQCRAEEWKWPMCSQFTKLSGLLIDHLKGTSERHRFLEKSFRWSWEGTL